jgi:NADPH2:quinone reductase
MQALKIDQHGPASTLQAREVPRLSPGPDEVLVEIEAAGINPSDVVSAEGRFPHSPLPRILGRDFAGRIVEGPDDLIGKEVWGSGGDLGISRDGTHAEYLVIPRAAVALRPSTLSAQQAAVVGVPFQTAWAALMERGQLKQGEWVIISGAAGAVGGAAVQIAAAQGANIIALVKDESEDARVDRARVAAIAHSDRGDLAEVVDRATAHKKAALAINAVGGVLFQPLLDALAEGGRMVAFSAIGGREVTLDLLDFYRADLTLYGLNTAFIDVTRGAQIMNALAPLFESGAIKPPTISDQYPLSRAAEAYQGLSAGKVVLIPDRYCKEE